jgi:indole-3-glycerol phosphate synthase
MNRLGHLIAVAHERSALARRESNLALLEEMARHHSPRGFRSKLMSAAQNGPAIIAELKRASPSQGLIRAEFVVATLAHELMGAGACALSVLTEEGAFGGSLGHLATASAASGLPCLRKDFIVDEVQLLEARAHGADAVLLIVAALSDSSLRSLLAMAQALELDALCEVHSDTDLERALAEGADLVGVNSRNLCDFSISRKSFDLIAKIPGSVVAVAESGIAAGDEIRWLRQRGYQAFLIGQTLMQAQRPGEKLKRLMVDAACSPSVRGLEKGA